MKVEFNPEWERAVWEYSLAFADGNAQRSLSRFRTAEDARLCKNKIPMFLVDGIPTQREDLPQDKWPKGWFEK